MNAIIKALLPVCALILGSLAGAAAGATRAEQVAPDREIMVMVPHPPEHFRPGASYGGSYGDELARSARERLASRLARQYDLTVVDNYPMPMIGVDCFIMAVPSGRSTEATIAQVSRDARVAWSQPVTLYQAQGAAAHNDPLYPAQPAARQWQLADLHRVSTGRGVRIAVIDSAIDTRHPDLAGQIAESRNFVAGSSSAAELHGTEVAGIIAARADNRLGMAGIAPGSRLLGLRACWQKSASLTVCDGFSLAKALYFAIEDKADVINLSLGGPDDRLLHELLKTALAHGAIVVAAYDRSRPGGGFPASMPGAIAVTDSALAGHSHNVYIAPGHDVPTTLPGGRWYLVNGSSFAAAHVSGLVALARQKPASGRPVLVSFRGADGAINACATLERSFHGCDCSCAGPRIASARLRY
jgi:subtilisin family serine protease